MKYLRKFIIVFVMICLTPTQVYAKREVIVGPTVIEESILTFYEDEYIDGDILPMGTISGSSLRIIQSTTPILYPTGFVSMKVVVYWEWLTKPLNHLEDYIVVTWDNTLIDWRYESSSILRHHYITNIQGNWGLFETETSVRDTSINGFAYDQYLINTIPSNTPPQRNKGDISFTVTSLAPVPSGTQKFNSFVNYKHKVVTVGFQGSVTMTSVSLGGLPSFDYGWAIGTSYDSMGTSFVRTFVR